MGDDVVSEINIDSALLKMSRIEMKLCMYVVDETRNAQSTSPSVVLIENTTFLMKKKALDNAIQSSYSVLHFMIRQQLLLG